MRLTRNNYHSREANEAYMSASLVKAMLDCPSRAIAELRGEYERPESTALLVGAYVDAYFEGKQRLFIAAHPEIINSRTGELKADFRKADEMILRATGDPVFMDFMRGRKQVIKTGKIGGIPVKCKMDFYVKGKRIVDLKTVKDMEPMYREGEGPISFVDYWRWGMQMAIYQAIEGSKLPCYLAVITKQEPPDIEIIEIPQHVLDTELEILRDKLPYLDAVRKGFVPPERCGKCAWCRATHKLSGAISLDYITE